jgi:peroxiredoxin
LQAAFSADDLVVLSVDIGESKEDIEKFLEQIPADFPVMVDPEGTTVKPWNVIAYPTTFVIDRAGIIRLAYYGGLEWDMPEIIEQLQTLVKQHL